MRPVPPAVPSALPVCTVAPASPPRLPAGPGPASLWDIAPHPSPAPRPSDRGASQPRCIPAATVGSAATHSGRGPRCERAHHDAQTLPSGGRSGPSGTPAPTPGSVPSTPARCLCPGLQGPEDAPGSRVAPTRSLPLGAEGLGSGAQGGPVPLSLLPPAPPAPTLGPADPGAGDPRPHSQLRGLLSSPRLTPISPRTTGMPHVARKPGAPVSGAPLGWLVPASPVPVNGGQGQEGLATHGWEGRSVGAPRKGSTAQVEPWTGTSVTW